MRAGPRDQRKPIRRPTDLAGSICFDPTRPVLRCRVSDISEQGGRLRLPGGLPTQLPDQFILAIALNERISWNCQLIWTAVNSVGVKFTGLAS
jgi:hypothetical protein